MVMEVEVEGKRGTGEDKRNIQYRTRNVEGRSK